MSLKNRLLLSGAMLATYAGTQALSRHLEEKELAKKAEQINEQSQSWEATKENLKQEPPSTKKRKSKS